MTAIRTHPAILALAASGLLILAGCKESAPPPGGEAGAAVTIEEAPKVGYRAPNFRLQTLQGTELNLAAYSGKVLFLNFWATWCGPCLAEMPSMEELYQEFKNDGLEILAISSDIEGKPVVEPYVQRLGLSYPILLDGDFYVHDKYQVRSVPTTVLIDQKGTITHKIIGTRDWSSPENKDLIARLLKSR